MGKERSGPSPSSPSPKCVSEAAYPLSQATHQRDSLSFAGAKRFQNLQPHQTFPAPHRDSSPTSHRIATRTLHCPTLQLDPATTAPSRIYSTSSTRPTREAICVRRKRYVTSIKRSTHSNSSCPTPHLQVSHRNPHPHHIHLYQPDHRPQHRLSSPPTMQAAVHLLPPSAPSAASRPDK